MSEQPEIYSIVVSIHVTSEAGNTSQRGIALAGQYRDLMDLIDRVPLASMTGRALGEVDMKDFDQEERNEPDVMAPDAPDPEAPNCGDEG